MILDDSQKLSQFVDVKSSKACTGYLTPNGYRVTLDTSVVLTQPERWELRARRGERKYY